MCWAVLCCAVLCCAVLCCAADEIGVQIEEPFGILPLEDCTDINSIYTLPTLHVVLCGTQMRLVRISGEPPAAPDSQDLDCAVRWR
jgi:hypothetical protein